MTGVSLLSKSGQGQKDEVRRHIEELAEMRQAVGNRVYPFAWIDVPWYISAPTAYITTREEK